MALPPDVAQKDAPGDPEEWVQSLLDHAQHYARPVAEVVQEAVHGDPQAILPQPARAWRVTDDGSAEWALRHKAMAEEEAAQVEAQYREWVDQLDAWKEARLRPLHAKAEFMTGHLEDYGRRVREASGGKVKSVALPSGAIRTTERPARVAVEDETAALDWARQLPPNLRGHVVHVVERLDLAVLKRLVRVQEVPLEAEVTFRPCGCIVTMRDPNEVEAKVGDRGLCPSCEEAATVGEVRPIEVRYLPLHVNAVPPGLAVVPPVVTVSVQLA